MSRLLVVSLFIAVISLASFAVSQRFPHDKQRDVSKPKRKQLGPHGGGLGKILRLLTRFGGIDFNYIVDGGANEGVWTKEIKGMLPNSTVLAIEGNQRMVPIINKNTQAFGKSVIVEVALLGDKQGKEVKFLNHATAHTGNSIMDYREQTKNFVDNTKVTVETRTLDTIDFLLEKRSFPCPDLLKLDIQGSELDALKGSPKTLKCAQAILVEVNVLRYNSHAPLANEMFAFMETQGFDLVEIVERHAIPTKAGPDVMIQLDALFVRRDTGAVDKLIKNGLNWMPDATQH